MQAYDLLAIPSPAEPAPALPPLSGRHTRAAPVRTPCATLHPRVFRSTVPSAPALLPRSYGLRPASSPPSGIRRWPPSGRLVLPPGAARRPASIPVSSARWRPTPPPASLVLVAVF